MPDTGYGSPMLLRVCSVVATYRRVDVRGPRGVWRRLLAGSPLLVWYRLCLPSIRIRPTASSAGRMIAEHLAIRWDGHWKFRRAQAVLLLPAEFPQYLRGRHRQAVRTNVRRARDAGLTVEHHPVEEWEPGSDDFRVAHITPGPVERWNVIESDGRIVAQAILSVDGDVALLHGLMSTVTHARWLLHTAIVERLCGTSGVLLVNSDDAYLLAPGTRHFQRLLGYSVARLRLPRSPREQSKRSRELPAQNEAEPQGA